MRGFTLIEILIVMVIISIVAGVAMMTITVNRSKQYEALAKQLTRVIQLAQQEAMLRPATIGFGISDRAYRFFIFKRDAKKHKTHWQPITDPGLATHNLPDKTHIALQVSGQPMPADETPQVIISASGDISPFVILIGADNDAPLWQVTGYANGEVAYAHYSAE